MTNPVPTSAQLGRVIRACREDLDLSRRHISVKLDVTERTVFRWERGDASPSLVKAIALANVLNTSLNDLIDAAAQS